ncbi:MAG: hypothetical protein ACE14V_08825 [bacterium]
MDIIGYVILMVNLFLGFGVAIPLSKYLGGLDGISFRQWQIYLILLGVYFIESISFAAGMASNIFSIPLSFLWGIIIRKNLPRFTAPPRKLITATTLFSAYTSLPALSMLVCPMVLAISGWAIFSPTTGLKFGIPGFFPWPVNTICGFFFTVGLSALFGKTIIATGMIALKLRMIYQKQ